MDTAAPAPLAPHAMPDRPVQRLPKSAYASAEWFERERRELFPQTWQIAGAVADFANVGDYATVTAGVCHLVVLRTADGALRAYHNACRHRGTRMLDGRGNTGKTIVCPYHTWAYGLDGRLRGVPHRASCYPDLDPTTITLHPAAVGTFGGFVFVCADPTADFDAWLGDLPDHLWPHDPTGLIPSDPVVYDMKANWKIYFENSIDGYHLDTLHDRTLGGPAPPNMVWELAGRHFVWYAQETAGRKLCASNSVSDASASLAIPMVPGAEGGDYGGVYMLFPTSVMHVSRYSIGYLEIIPIAADHTLLRTRLWSPTGIAIRPSQAAGLQAALDARDPADGRVKLSHLNVHPKETLNFTIEDMWICEKVQANMDSPVATIGPLAAGAGAESPLEVFQRHVLDHIAPA